MPDLASRTEREKATAAAILRGSEIEEELSATFEAAVWKMAEENRWEFPEDRVTPAADAWARAQAVGLSAMIGAGVEVSQSQADLIGITETTRAISAGEKFAVGLAVALLIMFAMPVRVWRTERDAKVCSVCSPLDGRKDNEWPAIFMAGPPAHPRCRCWIDWELAD